MDKTKIGVVAVILIFGAATTTANTTSSVFSRASRVRSGYGENCSKTVRCKTESWLSCDNDEGKCVCLKPDEMVYELSSRKCAVMIGERCRFGVGEQISTEITTGGSPWVELADCVEGAICGTDGVCKCPSESYEDAQGEKCLKKKGIRESCSSQVECDSSKFLLCLNSTCQCFRPNETKYDPESGVCKLKAGRSKANLPKAPPAGIPIQIWKEDAEEDWTNHIQGFVGVPCVDGSLYNETNKICSCNESQYIDIAQGKCAPKKDKGSPCLSKEECKNERLLTCTGGICACDPEVSVANPERVYDKYYRTIEEGVCLAKAGEVCTTSSASASYYGAPSNPNNLYCISGASCEANVCKCQPDYELTSSNTCGLAYNGVCSAMKPCSDRFLCTFIQDEKEYRCRCPNQNYQKYDASAVAGKKQGVCRGNIGTPCNPSIDPYSTCVANAKCIPQSGNERSICACKKGFVENSEGKCNIAYGELCEYSRYNYVKCDELAELECRMSFNENKTCSCRNSDDVYEPEKRTCSIPVGLPCRTSDECITNAVCLMGSIRNLFGICTYPDTLEELPKDSPSDKGCSCNQTNV